MHSSYLIFATLPGGGSVPRAHGEPDWLKMLCEQQKYFPARLLLKHRIDGEERKQWCGETPFNSRDKSFSASLRHGAPPPSDSDRDSDHFLLNDLAVFFQVDRILSLTACSLSGTHSVCPLSSLVF